MTTLSANIRTLRKKKGMTQKELADKCEVSSAAVSQWESPDKSVSPEFDKIRKIAKLFNITIDNLLDSENPIGCTKKGAGIDTQLMQEAFTALAMNKMVYNAFIEHDPATQSSIFSLFCILCTTLSPSDLIASPQLLQAIDLLKKD